MRSQGVGALSVAVKCALKALLGVAIMMALVPPSKETNHPPPLQQRERKAVSRAEGLSQGSTRFSSRKTLQYGMDSCRPGRQPAGHVCCLLHRSSKQVLLRKPRMDTMLSLPSPGTGAGRSPETG